MGENVLPCFDHGGLGAEWKGGGEWSGAVVCMNRRVSGIVFCMVPSWTTDIGMVRGWSDLVVPEVGQGRADADCAGGYYARYEAGFGRGGSGWGFCAGWSRSGGWGGCGGGLVVRGREIGIWIGLSALAAGG